MSKLKTIFYCSECGNEQTKWSGQCSACKAWNTLVEEPVKKENKAIKSSFVKNKATAKRLEEITADETIRISTGIKELDRVLGGGIVPSSVVLLGGDPGIGKSTILLQMCQNINKEIMYITGEESDEQIKLRASRLNVTTNNLLILAENSLDNIEDNIQQNSPDIVIIDSIQTIYRQEMTSAPGSVSQVREATASLTTIAKSTGTTIFVIGHVTKEGSLAGPRVLEHLVDTVLYFEGDRYDSYRILRAVKNRFGSTNEIGVFEMKNDGFSEITNPSGLFINMNENNNGCCIACVLEGTRPILVEIQSLVSTTNFGNPRRMSSGIDSNRLVLLLAVLEKKCGFKLGNQDVYINIVGGLKIDDRASDLSIIMSIISSYLNKTLLQSTAFIGEISLTGEIRSVSNLEKRINECEKMGLKNVVVPYNKDIKSKKINVIYSKNIIELINSLNIK